MVLHYDQALDWKWLCNEARLTDSQNRLGFVVWLSRHLSERHGDTSKARRLRQVEQALDGSRLLREGTFFEQVKSERMKNWLRERQSPEAKHWRVLTEFRPERVRHAY